MQQLRFAVPTAVILDGADDHVRTVFSATIQTIRASGAQVDEIDIPEFSQLAHINRQGGLNCAEAYAVHRETFQAHSDALDPPVASGILRGKQMDTADYIQLHQERAAWTAGVEIGVRQYDALRIPTLPVIYTALQEPEHVDEDYF